MLLRLAAICCLMASTLTGCGVGTNCAPPSALCDTRDGSTGRYTNPPQVRRVILECCDPDTSPSGACSGFGEWWGDVVLDGTANRVVVSVWPQDESSWTESHILSLVDRDPAGFWEIRYSEWDVAAVDECETFEECADQYEPSSRSLVPCSDPIARVRFIVEVYTTESDPVDCVTWGSVYPRPPDGCRDAVEAGVLY